MSDCQHCGDLIPEKRQARKAKYCQDICQRRAAEERKVSKKETQEVEAAPEMEDFESPYRADIEAMEAAKFAHQEAEEKRIAAEPERKKGNKSWNRNTASKLLHRDVLAVKGLVDGRHEKDPTGFYTWSHRDKVGERLGRGYKYASRKKLGIEPAQQHTGVSQGLSPDQVWANELVLMRQPLEYREDKLRYVELMTDAQTPDMEEAAQKYGFVNEGDNRPLRHGWFGKGEIQKHARKRLRRAETE